MASLNATRPRRRITGPGRPPNDFADELQAKRYVHGLASAAGIDSSRWHLHRSFGDGNRVFMRKSQLDEIFAKRLAAFKKLEEKQKFVSFLPATKNMATTVDFSKIPTKLFNSQLKVSTQAATEKLQQAERSLNSYQIYIRRFEKQKKAAQKEIAKIEATAKKVKDPRKQLEKGVNELITFKLWENPIIDGDFLYLNTVKNCKVKTQGDTGREHNLGRYGVAINLKHLALYVIPYEGNFVSGRYEYDTQWHPHVYESGVLCWGSAQTEAMNHLSALRLAELLQLLYSFLNFYNKDSPLITLSTLTRGHRFEKSDLENIKVCGAYLIHPDLR